MYDHNASRFDVVETKECIDCHNEFEITRGEKEFFEANNFTLPKRCKKCRKLKKINNKAQKQRDSSRGVD